ncbi:hypothetical protein [Streptomyces sp. NPDC057253]|uniref:hypothetical protein n=1 Tax=Streptomyces sp. NPDC057253 TaxID=3346069 RepID=UPI00362CDA37
MRTRTVGVTLIAASLLTLVGCKDVTTSSDSTADKPTTTATTSKQTDAGTAPTGQLADMRGKGLQSAQDQAQEAGFYYLDSHDALGRGRNQILDRDWKVCSQQPAAGEHPKNTKIDFGAVKLEEDCPSKDAGEQETAGTTMPNFKGKAVKVARQALDPSTSITVKDASGQDRLVLVESNWKVCSQTPSAGTKLDGQPVTLTAVKFEESC